VSPPQNVPEAERVLSVLAGSALGAAGLARGSVGGLGLLALGGALVYRGVTGHCHAYQALGISHSGYEQPCVGVRAQHGLRYDRSLAIQSPPETLYSYWRQLENLPRIMSHLVSVQQTDSLRSHWTAQAPMGQTIEWDAEIINERPDDLIAWRSVPGSQLDTAGSVHFEALPGNRGTLVHIELKYEPPGGKAAAALARLFGAGLEAGINEDLRKFKQLMETGEVASISGQPQGSCQS
jgi:uncharacterized membrane protein